MTGLRFFLLAAATFTWIPTVHAEPSVEHGQTLFQTKCSVCHNSDAAAGHAVGPNLHDVVGRPIGTADGFLYSAAMAQSKALWTPAELDAFLVSPATHLPGTAMPFSGLKKADDRKSIILYLRSLQGKNP